MVLRLLLKNGAKVVRWHEVCKKYCQSCGEKLFLVSASLIRRCEQVVMSNQNDKKCSIAKFLSFWEKDLRRPKRAWRVSLSQAGSDETAVPRADDKQDAQPGLENNPADGQIFSRKHPYFPKDCTACPFAGNKLAALVSNLAGRRDCNKCRACDKRIATAKRKAKAQQVSEDKAAIMSMVRAREMAEKRPNKLVAVKAMRTGKMLDSKKTFKSLYYHEINAGEVEALTSFYKKPSKAKFVRISPLGEGKDMSNPRDIANVAKKKAHGVLHYNVYELNTSNGVYLLKTEVRQKGFEIPYFIRRKE